MTEVRIRTAIEKDGHQWRVVQIRTLGGEEKKLYASDNGIDAWGTEEEAEQVALKLAAITREFLDSRGFKDVGR